MQRCIVFLVGKRPKPGTVVAEVVEALEGRGAGCRVKCRVLLPHEQQVGPADTEDADLVVHRGLSGRDENLLATLAVTGTRLCNPWRGTAQLRDRAAQHHATADAGVPSPRGVVRQSWAEVLADARTRRVVVKAVSGPGRGHGILAGQLPEEAPMDGPFLVEDRIDHDGTDRKLYVAGRWVAGLLKPSTLVHEHTTEGTPFVVDDHLAELARSAAAGLDLHLAGVDVVLGPDGPVVVDVNAFPGYRGVDGAGAAVAAHLLEHLEQ